MTFAAVPALRAHARASPTSGSRALTARGYDGALTPAAEKPGAICGMAMTEKQGGSDVRANTTTATPLDGGGPGAEYALVGHKWFCTAPMSDLVPRARPHRRGPVVLRSSRASCPTARRTPASSCSA